MFLHNPKTAGVSITTALRNATVNGQRILPQNTNVYVEGMHSTYEEALLRYPDLPSLYTFAFVRNPWDRVVSWYMFLQRKSFYTASILDAINHELLSTPQSAYTEGCTSVGRFESLDEDYETIRRVLQVDAPLPHLNNFPHTHYREYFDSSSRGLVAEKFASDIDAFGYSF